MKTTMLKRSVIALTSAGVLALISCSSGPRGNFAATAVYEEGVPGGVAVQTYTTTATVTGIDAANRKVTLVSPDGKMTTVKCGPDVVNFDQIRVGDQVKATVASELVVYMAKEGPPAPNGQAVVVGRAQPGSQPGALVAQTTQVTAKVSAIDLKSRKATLLFPDGTTKTFPVRKDVDLTQRQVGEEVVLRCTEAMAITVEKP